LRAGPYFSSYQAKDKLEELARILAKHGHGEGSLRAVDAIADIEDIGEFVEYDQASLVCEVARILAENGAVEAALSAVRASRPSWNRPAALTGVASAVAVAGDVRRAVEIAEAVGYPALAKAADALAGSGRIGEALPLAEDAIRRALAAPPTSPATADAVADLDHLTAQPDPEDPAGAGMSKPPRWRQQPGGQCRRLKPPRTQRKERPPKRMLRWRSPSAESPASSPRPSQWPVRRSSTPAVCWI